MPRETRTGPKHATEGNVVQVVCYKCLRETAHLVVRSAEYVDDYVDGSFSVTGWNNYQVIQCRGCERVGFRSTHQNTEEYDNDPDTGEAIPDTRIELYPNRLAGRDELGSYWTLPSVLMAIYRETLSAMRASLPVLAGVGIRAIVETVCADRKATGSNLEKRIDALVTQGALTKDGADILHRLRILGNQAAHEVKPHSLETLNTAMDVVDHLLTGVYILPARAKTLPQPKLPKGSAPTT